MRKHIHCHLDICLTPYYGTTINQANAQVCDSSGMLYHESGNTVPRLSFIFTE